MLQSRVGYPSAIKGQYFEPTHSLEMFQASVADLRTVEIQPLKSSQTVYVFQSSVSDLSTCEGQASELCQFLSAQIHCRQHA